MKRFIEPKKIRAWLSEHAPLYASAKPYPHAVIDGFIDPAALDEITREFAETSSDWVYYHHYNEKKRGFKDLARMGPVTQSLVRELQAPEFITFLEKLTGISGLLPDPDMDGGGLHEMKPGGFLNMHVDFMAHTIKKSWSRRLNLLLYMNRDWDESYNGSLEMWDKDMKRCAKKISPTFNRCVIFTTTRESFHGVPDRISCPEGRSRKSLALYYFRDEKSVCALRPTRYEPRPTDAPASKVLVRLDRFLLSVYAALKRRFRLRDETFTKLLKFFSK